MGSAVGDPVRRRTVVALCAAGLSTGLALAGCSGDSSGGAASSAASADSATPSPTPTPAEVVWAGQYCKDRAALDAAVAKFGRDLTITTSADIVEQLNRQLRGQALAVADALGRTVTTLAVVPPELTGVQADVARVVELGNGAQAEVDALSAQVAAVGEADGVLGKGAAALTALSAAKQSYGHLQELVTAVSSLAQSDDPQLQEAMAQAPECANG